MSLSHIDHKRAISDITSDAPSQEQSSLCVAPVDGVAPNDKLPQSSPKRQRLDENYRYKVDVVIRDDDNGTQEIHTIHAETKLSAFIKILNNIYDPSSFGGLSHCQNCNRIIRQPPGGFGDDCYGDFCENCGYQCSKCKYWVPIDDADKKKEELKMRVEEEGCIYKDDGKLFCSDCFNPCMNFEHCGNHCDVIDYMCKYCKKKRKTYHLDRGESISSNSDSDD